MKSYFKNLFSFNLFIGLLTLSFLLVTGNTFADPNVILGEAIKNAAKIKGSLPAKAKLKAYENIFKGIDKILAEHASSDQAIKILSDQKVGTFDPKSLRTAYIKELSSYYDTVCEVSPTYSCLGFVSLKQGNQQCENSKDLNGIVEAHNNLKNAARVFIGQKDANSYVPLALNSYRSCLTRSSFKATPFAKDQFTSDLLELLLKSNQESLARAAIENMTIPYFKFVGVLALQAYNKKPHDKAFSDRMIKYIKKKLKPKTGAVPMAKMALLTDKINRSDLPVTYMGDVKGGGGRNWGAFSTSSHTASTMPKCDYAMTKYLFDTVTDLHRLVWSKFKQEAQFKIMTESHENFAPFSTCYDKKTGLFGYQQMVSIYDSLLTSGKSDKAEEFKRLAIKEFWTDREQTKYYYDVYGKDKEWVEKIAERMIKNGYGPGPHQRGAYVDSPFFLFTKLVDYESVCNASAMLFKKIKNGPDFDKAIKYMITSSNVDPNKKYKCGDEDLELLLN
jgi:hypothetical protein